MNDRVQGEVDTVIACKLRRTGSSRTSTNVSPAPSNASRIWMFAWIGFFAWMNPKNDMEDAQEYPWEDVEAARKNGRLQRRHSVGAANRKYLAQAKACPRCGTVANELAWFYFDSPLETWNTLCGCAGWMTVCDRCHVQVDFFLEAMS